jgi:hydrogenase-4 component E
MLVLVFLLIVIDLIVISTKNLSYVPMAICLQVVVIAKADYISGMDIALIGFVCAIKAVIIPFLLYHLVKKTNAPGLDVNVVHPSIVAVITTVALIAAYVFARSVGAGPFGAAAFFTMLAGILLITCRETILDQLAGFIVLQNGIFAFVSSFLAKTSLVMELFPAVDVLITVAMMFFAIRLIYKHSGSIEIKTFSTLRG